MSATADTSHVAFAVGKLEKTFRDDVTRGANALPQLLALCRADTADEEERAFLALKALVRCFRSAFAHQLYQLAVLPSQRRVEVLDVIAQDGEQRAAAEALVDWASTQYRKAVDAIVALVAHAEAGLQVPAIQALFDLMQLEISVRLNAKADAELHASWIDRLFAALLWDGDRVRPVHAHALAVLRATLFAYVDTRVCVWRALAAAVRAAESRDPSVRAALCNACLELARLIGPPDDSQSHHHWLAPVSVKEQRADRALATQKRAFSDLWGALLASPMTRSAYASVLRAIDTELVPHLRHPIAVVDFCLAAYEMGGHIALLSLQSLFAIATRLNVDVPQFYPKLYALLCGGNAVFVSGHRAQLFELTDVFLSSEYLPLSYAASFVKKLCRMALEAPAYGAIVCLQLVFNVLRRHPVTMSLIHSNGAAVDDDDGDGGSAVGAASEPTAKRHKWRRAEAVDRRTELRAANNDDDDDDAKDDLVLLDGQELEHSGDADAGDVEMGDGDDVKHEPEEEGEDKDDVAPSQQLQQLLLSDPFDADELDPGQTGALSSSLWELVALQRHYAADVADLALLFARDMQRPLFDVSLCASHSAKAALDKMRKKKAKHGVPLEHRLRESIVPSELAAFYAGGQ